MLHEGGFFSEISLLEGSRRIAAAKTWAKSISSKSAATISLSCCG